MSKCLWLYINYLKCEENIRAQIFCSILIIYKIFLLLFVMYCNLCKKNFQKICNKQ